MATPVSAAQPPYDLDAVEELMHEEHLPEVGNLTMPHLIVPRASCAAVPLLRALVNGKSMALVQSLLPQLAACGSHREENHSWAFADINLMTCMRHRGCGWPSARCWHAEHSAGRSPRHPPRIWPR